MKRRSIKTLLAKVRPFEDRSVPTGFTNSFVLEQCEANRQWAQDQILTNEIVVRLHTLYRRSIHLNTLENVEKSWYTKTEEPENPDDDFENHTVALMCIDYEIDELIRSHKDLISELRLYDDVLNNLWRSVRDKDDRSLPIRIVDPEATQAALDAFGAVVDLFDNFTLDDLDEGNTSLHDAYRLAKDVLDSAEWSWQDHLLSYFAEPFHDIGDILNDIGPSSLPPPFRALAGALTAAVHIEPGMSNYDRLVRLRAQVTEITRAALSNPDRELSLQDRRKLLDGPGSTLGAGVEQP